MNKVTAADAPAATTTTITTTTASTGNDSSDSIGVANIAVIGAGWWSQGWHLPVLHRNPKVNLIAIVDTVNQPTSKLNPNLEPLPVLEKKYHPVKIFHSVHEMLMDPSVGPVLDGVLVATPHATHYTIARQLMQEITKRKDAMTGRDVDDSTTNCNSSRPLHIMMEKPMTTDLEDAINLYKLVMEDDMSSDTNITTTTNNNNSNNEPPMIKQSQFWINHTANYRIQSTIARETITGGKLGTIRHITAHFSSPLTWIFNDPNNAGWNVPTGNMVGNGFAWGQSSHLLAFVFHIVPTLKPISVYCKMTHSSITGADLSHSATIVCIDETTDATSNNSSNDNDNMVTMSISGTALLPGHQYATPPIGKLVQIEVYGDGGSIHYSGNDLQPTSGRLEYRAIDGTVHVLCDTFEFESYENEEYGPESIQQFVALCCSSATAATTTTTTLSPPPPPPPPVMIGANVVDGLRSVQVIDAMYKSHRNNRVETITSI
jgi:predicted dehydrogenase